MGLYLYCIVGTSQPDPVAVQGVDGAGVRALDVAGLRTWVSSLAAPPGASLERAREHNSVVEGAMTHATPLPVRFGQFFESESEMRDVLEEGRDRLARALERVADAAELGVRVLGPESPAPDPPDRTTGRAYLEGLARREETLEQSRRQGARVAAELHAFLGPLVRAQVVRPGGTSGLVAISHLVARHDTGAYRDQLHTFTDRYPDLRFVVSGPWPPYGFADDAD